MQPGQKKKTESYFKKKGLFFTVKNKQNGGRWIGWEQRGEHDSPNWQKVSDKLASTHW